MRVSTSQIFDSGFKGINRNQYEVFRLQNQLSTGRRVLTPQDDPIAAAQALVLTQAQSVAEQHLTNQEDAQNKLGVAENQLNALGDLLQNVREKLVQAGSTTLSNADRTYIVQELEARYSELLGIANAQDGAGNYLFSGYQGTVRPFAETQSGAQYYGDEGQRLQQVAAGRQLATNVSGADLFEKISTGNGNFLTSTGGNSGGGINQGSGVIDQGSVTDTNAWRQAVDGGYGALEVRFTVTGTTTQYEIYSGGTSISATPLNFTAGQSIPLVDTVASPSVNLGAAVVITGTPANGDSFEVNASTNQSMFQTLRETIGVLKSGIGSVVNGNSSTEYVNNLAKNMQNIDQAMENVTKVRATVGSYLKELDSLHTAGEDMSLQYQMSLSELQDLDYTKAITEMSQKTLQLKAAQLSFKQTSQLSLFSIL